MSLKIRFYCLKFSIFIVTLLIFQTTNAQKKEKPLVSKYNFSNLDKILEEKKSLLGQDYVVLIWKKDDTLTYKKEVGEYKSKTIAPIAAPSSCEPMSQDVFAPSCRLKTQSMSGTAGLR